MIFKARLIVNEVELAVAGASIDAPEGALGYSLTVALAQRHIGGVPPGAAIDFAIGMKEAIEDAYVWVTLLSAGKLLGRDYTLSWEEGKPGDTVNFNALSPLSDRWSLRPLKPVTLYNPLTVDTATMKPDTANPLRYGLTQEPIPTVFEPIRGLNLRQALDRIYTGRLPHLAAGHAASGAGVGCGFAGVVTNLPDFPIDRIDITLEGGWHAAATAIIGEAFEPIYFELDNILYIIDPGRGLPTSFPVRSLSLSCMGEASHIIQPGEIVNSIILAYEVRNPEQSTGSTVPGGMAGLIPSDRNDPGEPVITANARVIPNRKLRDWKDLATGQVAYTQELQSEVNTYAKIEGAFAPVSLEITQVRYQGKLKVGHTKTTQARYPNPDAKWADEDTPLFKFGAVHTEECRIDWTVDAASPGDAIEKRVVTETEGLVLVEGDKRKTYTPILDAAKSDLIKGDGSQHTERKPIDTMIEELRVTGYNQAQIVPTIIHHLTGTIETPPATISRTGSPSTRAGADPTANASGLTVIKELYVLEDSIAQFGARRAATLNIGQLDPVEGRKMVQRRLYRLANPRKTAPFAITNGIDFLLHKGSIARIPLRSGAYDAFYIATSYRMVLRGLLTKEPSITHSFNGIELG